MGYPSHCAASKARNTSASNIPPTKDAAQAPCHGVIGRCVRVRERGARRVKKEVQKVACTEGKHLDKAGITEYKYSMCTNSVTNHDKAAWSLVFHAGESVHEGVCAQACERVREVCGAAALTPARSGRVGRWVDAHKRTSQALRTRRAHGGRHAAGHEALGGPSGGSQRPSGRGEAPVPAGVKPLRARAVPAKKGASSYLMRIAKPQRPMARGVHPHATARTQAGRVPASA